MQKKIMLALIISSNGMIVCQEPAPLLISAPPAQAQPVATAPVVAPAASVAAPIIQAPVQAPLVPTVVTPVVVTPPTAAATPAAVAPVQMQPAASAEIPAQTISVPAESPAAAPEPQPVEQPKPVEEFHPQPEQAAEEDLEIKGIDTADMSEPKGNWLYKRIWWEKAEHTYEKIKQLTDKILESRMIFFVKRNELDRMIVEFYSDLGFKQGEITELMDFMTRQLDHERTTEGSLDEKERALLELLTQEKKNIEQLQQGTQNIKKIDEAIEDALMKLLEQLNQAKYYEQQAWQHFKAINRELSDKKARELFYGMDTYWRNLNNINSYLSDAFSKYFDSLSEKMHQETDKIKTNVQALSEKGINLQSQALAMKKECKMPSKEEVQPEEPQPSTGLLGSVWNIIKAPFSAVGSIFGWVFGLFGGSESGEVALAKPARSAAKNVALATEEPS